ncbi:MAG: hypothetical protein LPH21_06975 [Shewanella sp.]|nr:hypothetical protein [Shewanella sp.]
MQLEAVVEKKAVNGTVASGKVTATLAKKQITGTIAPVLIAGSTTHRGISATLEPLRLECTLTRGHDREVEASEMAYAKRVDTVGDIVYTGTASVGTTDNQPKWRIKRAEFTDDGDDVAITYAEGTEYFDKTWDQRESYTYR